MTIVTVPGEEILVANETIDSCIGVCGQLDVGESVFLGDIPDHPHV
jgi:hypothetical protein